MFSWCEWGISLVYIKALKENIHSTFDGDLPIVGAFSIFNPLTLPAPGTAAFKEHGSKQVKTLADHSKTGRKRQRKSNCWQSGKSLNLTWILGSRKFQKG